MKGSVMLVVTIVPVVIALLGALVFAFSSNPKASQLGLVAFGCGLLVFCFALSGHVVHIG